LKFKRNSSGRFEIEGAAGRGQQVSPGHDREGLSRAGFLVSTAADGEEALRIAKEQLPDIVLLDMMIPKISGPDVLKALKENPATTHIPVIVLSSLSQQNEERLIGQGAAAYFEKSTLELDKGSDRLATTIQSVLNRARKQSKPQA